MVTVRESGPLSEVGYGSESFHFRRNIVAVFVHKSLYQIQSG
jgi:hypothetical protein